VTGHDSGEPARRKRRRGRGAVGARVRAAGRQMSEQRIKSGRGCHTSSLPPPNGMRRRAGASGSAPDPSPDPGPVLHAVGGGGTGPDDEGGVDDDDDEGLFVDGLFVAPSSVHLTLPVPPLVVRAATHPGLAQNHGSNEVMGTADEGDDEAFVGLFSQCWGTSSATSAPTGPPTRAPDTAAAAGAAPPLDLPPLVPAPPPAPRPPSPPPVAVDTDTCPICLDDLVGPIPKPKPALSMSPCCGGTVCLNCIAEIATRRSTRDRRVCPLCFVPFDGAFVDAVCARAREEVRRERDTRLAAIEALRDVRPHTSSAAKGAGEGGEG
jgi:hypothetical protein